MNGSASLAHLCEAFGIDLVRNEVQVIDGSTLPGIVSRHPFGSGLFPWTPLRPMLIANIGAPEQVEAASTLLHPRFATDHPVRIARSDVEPTVVDATIGTVTGVPAAWAMFVPASDPLSAGGDPQAFQHIIARLRDTEGCPWDRTQSHQSLRDVLIDEVYEVVDAIDSGDQANLAEELGDLFLLIVMHAQIATESGSFVIEDVYRSVATKIVGRHPHVFGDVEIAGLDDLTRVWNDAKRIERRDRPDKGGAKADDGEPWSMPALTRASRVLRKHPRQAGMSDDTADPAESMLDMMNAMIANGDDPEARLREALARHVLRGSARNADLDD